MALCDHRIPNDLLLMYLRPNSFSVSLRTLISGLCVCCLLRELARLSNHLEQFCNTLHRKFPVAKKLDFLCQEMNREINTIGSKSNLLEISQAVIEAKEAVEKIREQLRNVE